MTKAFNIYEAEDEAGQVSAFILELAKRRREESQEHTNTSKAHLDQLQALVDNWIELEIGPSDGLHEARAYLEANGRSQPPLEIEEGDL